jgi:hypothetical protein
VVDLLAERAHGRRLLQEYHDLQRGIECAKARLHLRVIDGGRS